MKLDFEKPQLDGYIQFNCLYLAKKASVNKYFFSFYPHTNTFHWFIFIVPLAYGV